MKSEIINDESFKENDLVSYKSINGVVIFLVRSFDDRSFDGTVLYTENSTYELGDFKRNIPLSLTSKFTGTLLLKNE